MRNHYALEGKVAIVTGAAGGIGQAIAKALAASGARLALWDRQPMPASLMPEGADESDHACLVDVTDEHEVELALSTTVDTLGPVSILVNAAGILGVVAPAHEHPVDVARQVMDVNFTGTLICSAAVVRHMLAAGTEGRIINIASIQGKEGTAQGAAYSASKAAMIALTKSMGKELAAAGILVNAITPAIVETAMAREISDARRQELLAKIPMGRFCEAGEVAAMTAFLASPDCSFTTGAVFDLSGGRATY